MRIPTIHRLDFYEDCCLLYTSSRLLHRFLTPSEKHFVHAQHNAKHHNKRGVFNTLKVYTCSLCISNFPHDLKSLNKVTVYTHINMAF